MPWLLVAFHSQSRPTFGRGKRESRRSPWLAWAARRERVQRGDRAWRHECARCRLLLVANRVDNHFDGLPSVRGHKYCSGELAVLDPGLACVRQTVAADEG